MWIYAAWIIPLMAITHVNHKSMLLLYIFSSVSLNQRVRVRCFAVDDEFPVVHSLVDVWPGINWEFERECFDLFGVIFEVTWILRRILTDYGFVGHPFRKDFPTTGHVEMRYMTPNSDALCINPSPLSHAKIRLVLFAKTPTRTKASKK